MLESKFICDLCGKVNALVRQGHAGHVLNPDRTLNYTFIDVVHAPAGWVAVGVNCICQGCAEAVPAAVAALKTPPSSEG